MKKEPDESSVWPWLWSNQAAILSALVTAQALLPVWQGIIPEQWFVVAGALLATVIPILRGMKQKGVQKRLDKKRRQHQWKSGLESEMLQRQQGEGAFSDEATRRRNPQAFPPRSSGSTTGGPRRDMRNVTTDDVTRTAAVTSAVGMSSSDCGSSSSTDSGSSSSSCDSGSSF